METGLRRAAIAAPLRLLVVRVLGIRLLLDIAHHVAEIVLQRRRAQMVAKAPIDSLDVFGIEPVDRQPRQNRGAGPFAQIARYLAGKAPNDG
jgi:hypothetical protein